MESALGQPHTSAKMRENSLETAVGRLKQPLDRLSLGAGIVALRSGTWLVWASHPVNILAKQQLRAIS